MSPTSKTCSSCKADTPLDEFGRSRGTRDGLNYRCRPCVNRESKAAYSRNRSHKSEYEKVRYADARSQALLLLGGVCRRCGFADPRALQIDHVNGGGCEENRRIKPRGIIQRVLAGASGYQLLCANCNSIKRVENGETPWRQK